jgi:hypothetical protein
MMSQKEYLGDSVYADWDGFGIVLTTENGFGASNTICLEPEVLKALNAYVDRIKKIAESSSYVVEWLLRDGKVSRGATLHPTVEAAEADIDAAFRNRNNWSSTWRIVEAVSGKTMRTNEALKHEQEIIKPAG